MKLTELIAELQDILAINGDMNVSGIVDDGIFKGIELNCPEYGKTWYVEL